MAGAAAGLCAIRIVVDLQEGFEMQLVLARRMSAWLVLPLVLSLHALSGAQAQSRDVAGAKDYPGIGRFAGSVITGYLAKDFDAARLQAAAFKDGNPTDARRLEGRITRIAY